MPKTTIVLEIDKPHFTVKLYENVLKIDLKGSIKNTIEEALENKPVLKETIGEILGIFAPLHIRLSHIDSVHVDETGKVKLVLPLHRDVTIPLKLNEARRLAGKLNQLIPREKQKELERVLRKRRFQRIAEKEEEMTRGSLVSGPVFPVAEPGVFEKEKEAEEHIEEEKED